MSKLAIDVALLPPADVMDLCISWNRRLADRTTQSILLNKSDLLPHVSLVMGCLPTVSLHKVENALKGNAGKWRPLRLHVNGVHVINGSPTVVSLDIAFSDQLLLLQRELIETLKPWLTQDAEASDLFDPPPISWSTINWINRFIPDQCGERFWPHITIGHGATDVRQESFDFIARRLAVCHLGNHCTCRRVVAEVILGG